VIGPFGVLVTGEIDLAFFHLQGRGSIDQANEHLRSGRHLEAFFFREEDVGVRTMRVYVHRSIISVFKLHLLLVDFAQLDLE
jgi:hypothetical protein